MWALSRGGGRAVWINASRLPFRELTGRARNVIRSEGFVSLLVKTVSFLRPFFFQYGHFHLCKYRLVEREEAEFMPDIPDVTCRIVVSNREADELAAEGFEFRSRLIGSRRNLDEGAVATCLFVGCNIAHISWSATTEASKVCTDDLPCRVDFANREAYVSGTLTLPQYRNKGLMEYGCFKQFEYLRKCGIEKVRNAIGARNVPSGKGYGHFSPKVYAEARYLKVLFLGFYRERPLREASALFQVYR